MKMKFDDVLSQLQFIGGLTRDLQSVREGGLFEQSAAVISIVTKVREHFRKREGLGFKVNRLNLRQQGGREMMFFASLARRSPDFHIDPNESQPKVWWLQPEGAIEPVACVMSQDHQDNLYFKEGFEAQIREIVMKETWRNSKSLRLFRNDVFAYEIAPASVKTHVVGQQRLNGYIERLRKRKAVGGRSIILRGPTGVGKSFLARYMARKVWGEDVKMLQITAEAVASMNPRGIEMIAQWLRPDVMILDDVPLGNGSVSSYLALYESLRETGCTIITTLMTSADANPSSDVGSVYFPGMRPGRIDDVFTLTYPNLAERREILDDLYFEHTGYRIRPNVLNEMAQAIGYFSFAYLESFVERLVVYGIPCWKEELASLKMMSPIVKGDVETEAPLKDDLYEPVLEDDLCDGYGLGTASGVYIYDSETCESKDPPLHTETRKLDYVYNEDGTVKEIVPQPMDNDFHA